MSESLANAIPVFDRSGLLEIEECEVLLPAPAHGGFELEVWGRALLGESQHSSHRLPRKTVTSVGASGTPPPGLVHRQCLSSDTPIPSTGEPAPRPHDRRRRRPGVRACTLRFSRVDDRRIRPGYPSRG